MIMSALWLNCVRSREIRGRPTFPALPFLEMRIVAGTSSGTSLVCNTVDLEHGHGAMCAQEAKAKEAIQQLKFEVANLQRLAAADVAGARSAADQAALDDLQAQKAAIAADRDAKVRSVLSSAFATASARQQSAAP